MPTLDTLVSLLGRDFPQFEFLPGEAFYWSSETRQVFYKPKGSLSSLMHELGHALLGHQAFQTDVELLRKEVDAWEKARELASNYDVTINDEIVERCLDTYRDWLHSRSTCPTCRQHGVQSTERLYSCLNCAATWKVSRSVLCRVYRQREGALIAK